MTCGEGVSKQRTRFRLKFEDVNGARWIRRTGKVERGLPSRPLAFLECECFNTPMLTPRKGWLDRRGDPGDSHQEMRNRPMARSPHGTAARAVPVADPRLPIDEYVRSLLQAFDVGVILHGPRAEVRFANQAALEMCGMTQEQMSGQTSKDLDFIVLQEDGTECPFSTAPRAASD